MRQVRSIFTSIAIGCALTAICLALFSMVRPVAASGGDLHASSPDAARTGGAAIPHSAVVQPMASSARLTQSFGSIELITTVAKVVGIAPTDVHCADVLACELALAMDVPPAAILAAHLVCDHATPDGCTDPSAVGAMGLAPGTWFPTHGPSFAILSTGRVTDALNVPAEPANTQPSLADPTAEDQRKVLETLGGLNNSDGDDLVRLKLRLQPPPNTRCLSLDFTFYTVDIPFTTTVSAACQIPYGDTFSAQINQSTLQIVSGPGGKVVDAPGNIAFNYRGEQIATHTMSPTAIYEALNSPIGSNVPGAFPLLQMRHPVTDNQPFDLYLSIQDLGDSIGNSAVALDNFTWVTDTDPDSCLPNPGNNGDRDGDGLPDGWEEHGTYTRDGENNLYKLDLQKLGADPKTKDIFVEVDALSPWTEEGHTFDPRPRQKAMAAVVAAFARAPVDPILNTAPVQYKGIRLHIDYGPGAPMLPRVNGATARRRWGSASEGDTLGTFTADGEAIPHPYLCGTLCSTQLDPLWQQLDKIKQSEFGITRSTVFHYSLFAHRLAECTGALSTANRELCNIAEVISGISRNLTNTTETGVVSTADGASDFIVSLGDKGWSTNGKVMEVQQAGTFMHELGHNLGLNHYGAAGDLASQAFMRKPNHLSVMNYLYQTSGLVVSNPAFLFDYSRYNMAVLDEDWLTETNGIYLAESGIAVTYTLGIRHHCNTTVITVAKDVNHIDWNCEQPHGQVFQYNINGDLKPNSTARQYSKLAAVNEWDQLVFTGGLLNRQRSMLQHHLAVRTVSCPFAGENNDHWSFPAPPGLQPPPAMRRIYIPPQSLIIPDSPRWLFEELTPEMDRLIPP